MIHPTTRILQESRHVSHGRTINVPVERRLALEGRSIRQSGGVDWLALVRGVSDDPIPEIVTRVSKKMRVYARAPEGVKKRGERGTHRPRLYPLTMTRWFSNKILTSAYTSQPIKKQIEDEGRRESPKSQHKSPTRTL